MFVLDHDVILVLEIFSVAHVIPVKRGFSQINVRKISLKWVLAKIVPDQKVDLEQKNLELIWNDFLNCLQKLFLLSDRFLCRFLAIWRKSLTPGTVNHMSSMTVNLTTNHPISMTQHDGDGEK